MNLEAMPTFTQFSLRDLPPAERYPVWKESISVIFDVDWDQSNVRQPFDASVASAHLGQVMLVETTSLGQRFDRTPTQIRHDGVDHCLIQIYLEGDSRGLWGVRDHSIARPGDVLFLDTAQPVQSQVSDFRNLTLVVPRGLIVPHLGSPERHHGSVLSRNSSSGRLLSEHLRLLWQLLRTTPADEARSISLGMLDLIGRYFGGDRPIADHDPTSTHLALREIIRAHIEKVLEEPELGPDDLAKRFGLSRATLYRLFEPLGGVSGYIQSRRLRRAHSILIMAGYGGTNLTSLALRLGFKHPSHFSRVFRGKFGYSPSEVCENNLLPRVGLSKGLLGVDRTYERWVRELG